MTRNRKAAFPKFLGAMASLLCLGAIPAHSAMTRVDDPRGSRIEYGRVDGQSTEAGAMAALLHALHGQYGERPQVSKLFQVRGTQSVAAFFSVNKRSGGKGQQAGLIIVTKIATDDVEGAVISDDAARLGTSLNPAIKRLFAAWHPFEGALAGGGGASARPAPLHPYTTRDGTASVQLPEGWRPQAWSAGGTIVADGPNGESLSLGYAFLAEDLNNPSARQTYNTVMRGGLRGTVYANGIYYPLSRDLTRDYLDLMRAFHSKHNLPPVNLQVKSSTPMAGPPGQYCVHIQGVGSQEQRPSAELDTIFCIGAPSPTTGIFMAVLNESAIPLSLAARERSTMGMVLASYSVDSAKVQRMANAYAAPAIELIHAVGRAAAAQADGAHEREAIQNSSVYQHWDSMDRRSKEFSNYQLGFSTIQDNYWSEHHTLWNDDADFLVKYDPQRFEYVNAPNFWKGVDY